MSLKFLTNIIPAVLGGAGGFLLYKYVGCVTGTCPITSNPWSSVIFGAFLGLMISQSWS